MTERSDAHPGSGAAGQSRTDGTGETTVRRTRRWRGVTAVTLVTVAAGLLTTQPALVLAACVGAAYAAYPHVSGPPSVELAIERTIDDATPAPDDEVAVTVAVTNEGDRTLANLRLVDGVAPLLAVTGGTARYGTVLRPGATAEFSYTVRASAGRHRFGAATVAARDASGGTEVETTVPVDGDGVLSCERGVAALPVRRRTLPEPGPVPTDAGGGGTEFCYTREYRPGDPLNRIDWRRFARTGVLTTVQFRAERNVAVVLCVDARPPTYRGPPDGPCGTAQCIAVADGLLAAVDGPERVGIATLEDDPLWIPPGAGRDHRDDARARLTDRLPAGGTFRTDGRFWTDGSSRPGGVARSGDPSRTDGSVRPDAPSRTDRAVPTDAPPRADEPPRTNEHVESLAGRLGPETQVAFVSPLLDEAAVRTVLGLERDGHAVLVVSPDATSTDTLGGAVAAVERDDRIRRLRDAGVPVVDYGRDGPVTSRIVDAPGRWST